MLTSEYLLDMLRALDQEDPDDQTLALSPDDCLLLRQLQEQLFDARATLSTEDSARLVEALAARPDVCGSFLDDLYSRDLVKQVPKFVKRTLRFDPMVTTRLPHGPVNTYLRQAMQSYVHGLFLGTVVLARAALEFALSERVPDAGTGSYSLEALITAASRYKLLDNYLVGLAGDVRVKGNIVLHQCPIEAHEALDVFTKARTVIEALYRTR